MGIDAYGAAAQRLDPDGHTTETCSTHGQTVERDDSESKSAPKQLLALEVERAGVGRTERGFDARNDRRLIVGWERAASMPPS